MKIFIVDHHQMVTDGIVCLLQEDSRFKVVGSAVSEAEAVRWFSKNEADLLLIDVNLQHSDGLELIKTLKRKKIPIKIIVLSGINEVKKIKDLFKMGIDGYIEKTEGFEKLYVAMERVANGEIYLGESLKEKIVNSFTLTENKTGRSSDDLFSSLTTRELEVMNLICDGLSSKEISDKLFISVNTVETHRQHILQKLNVKSSLGLIKFAVAHQLVS